MRRLACACVKTGGPLETSRSQGLFPLLLTPFEVASLAGSVAWRLAARSAGEQAWPAAAAAGSLTPVAPCVIAAQMLSCRAPAHSTHMSRTTKASPVAAPASSRQLWAAAAGPTLRSSGLAAALGAPDAPTPALPPVFRRAALYHHDSWDSHPMPPGGTSSYGPVRTSGGDGSGGSAGPGPHFQRWLDDMKQQGYSVEFNAARGNVEVKGRGGKKLDLFVKKKPSQLLRHLWMAGAAAAFGATFKAAGPEAAATLACALALTTAFIWRY